MEKEGCISQDPEVRKGPWTMEEDLILMNYISNHGDGVWNSLAKSAGLRCTGKSCRLRWLNYLRPDIRRGNITSEEQLLIMELHAKLGNRWSKIAKHLPGRTDNEIKNYWRTRIQKHIKQGESSVQHDLETSHPCQHPSGFSPMGAVDTTITGYGEPCFFQPSYQGHIEAFDRAHAPAEPNNNHVLWSMEDLLSMQLFNGD